MTIQAALNVNSYPKGIKISEGEWNYSIRRRMTSALKIALLHVIRVRMPPPADGGAWPGPVPARQDARPNLWLFKGAPAEQRL